MRWCYKRQKNRLAIEICVTHPVDDVKRDKLERDGMDCIEIKIPKDCPMKIDVLKELVINDIKCKKWINNPTGDTILLEKEKEKQKERILEFKKKHPECKGYLIERCSQCQIMQTKLEMKWTDLVDKHNYKLQEWHESFLSKTLNDIVNLNIIKKGDFHNPQFVWREDEKHYLYPNDINNDWPDYLDNPIYAFCNEMKTIVDLYHYLKNHENCPHCCAKINYDGDDYVFCDYEKNTNKFLDLYHIKLLT